MKIYNAKILSLNDLEIGDVIITSNKQDIICVMDILKKENHIPYGYNCGFRVIISQLGTKFRLYRDCSLMDCKI